MWKDLLDQTVNQKGEVKVIYRNYLISLISHDLRTKSNLKKMLGYFYTSSHLYSTLFVDRVNRMRESTKDVPRSGSVLWGLDDDVPSDLPRKINHALLLVEKGCVFVVPEVYTYSISRI